MDPIEQFNEERKKDIEAMANDEELKKKSIEWMVHADKYKYTYNYSWMGSPIIKYPNDMVLMQEIIWDLKPDLIIETGIAHGGSIIFSASMLELLGGDGKVLAIDIDIREHNKKKIENNPMYKRITMIEGDCLAPEIIEQVRKACEGKKKVLVMLDSNHTHDHVLKEMKLYQEFVTVGSYLILPDTFIEFFPKGYYSNRPWDVGDNPWTALQAFLKENDDFVIDKERENKMMIKESFDGYLRRIK